MGSCAGHRNSAFFVVLCAFFDSVFLFRKPRGFDYHATSINYRATDFTEKRIEWPFYPLDIAKSQNDIRSRRSLDLMVLFYPPNFEIIETDGHIAFRLSSRI